jgi:glucose-6-phosphate dehydrogenase assembly protein OpcA
VTSGVDAFAAFAEPRTVALADVEDALFQLRCEARRALDDSGHEHPASRACMSNLIVYCDSPAAADALPTELGAIAGRHPARIILLVSGADGQEKEIETRISAQLVATRAGPQVASEQIRVDVKHSAQQHLPSAARPLLIGDLPTSLWWTSQQPPPAAGALLRELEGMASSVVYDSRGWPDPRRGMIETAAWVGAPDNRQLVADLAWLQLRFWRQLIAETLAPDVLPGALAGIEKIEIEHGPHAMPMAWLLIGWLADCLDWKPDGGQLLSDHEHALRFVSQRGAVVVEVRRNESDPLLLRDVKIHARPDTQAELTAQFASLERDRLVARFTNGRESETIVSAPDDPRAVMLAWQLTNRTGQPIFRNALAMGRIMANTLRS